MHCFVCALQPFVPQSVAVYLIVISVPIEEDLAQVYTCCLLSLHSSVLLFDCVPFFFTTTLPLLSFEHVYLSLHVFDSHTCPVAHLDVSLSVQFTQLKLVTSYTWSLPQFVQVPLEHTGLPESQVLPLDAP